MNRILRSALLGLSFFFPAVASADPILVTPGQVLEIKFSIPHPLQTFTDYNGSTGTFLPDMLYFDLSGVTIHGPIGVHSASLFDGDSLLGVVTNDLVGNSFIEMGSFMSADSLLYAGPNRQTVIDITSILNGTIDGRLLFTISRGSLAITDATALNAQVALGLGPTFASKDSAKVLSLGTVRVPCYPRARTCLRSASHHGCDTWQRSPEASLSARALEHLAPLVPGRAAVGLTATVLPRSNRARLSCGICRASLEVLDQHQVAAVADLLRVQNRGPIRRDGEAEVPPGYFSSVPENLVTAIRVQQVDIRVGSVPHAT